MSIKLVLFHQQLEEEYNPNCIASNLQPAGLHEFHETCHSVTFHFMKKDSKLCFHTTSESIHTKDESKRGSAFAFIFGVN